MRYLILILFALSVGATACSKKKSNSVVIPPTPVPPINDGYDDYYGNPSNGQYYGGYVNIYNRSVYKNFLRAAYGYQAYGYNYGDSQSYNYNYTCDINIYRWIFDDNLVDCNSGQDQFNDYINDLSYAPAAVELVFLDNYRVEGRWIVGGYQNYSYGYGNNYQQINFNGIFTRLNDGRYLIQAGPLAFLTNTTSGYISPYNFKIYMEETEFGNVTIY